MKLKLSTFTVLIFIIIVAIIVMTPDITKALLIILLVVQMASWVKKDNTMLLSLQEKPTKAPEVQTPSTQSMRQIIPVESPPQFAPSGLGGPNNLDLYGIYYDKWNNQRSAYTNSYNEPRPRVGTSCAERNYSVDSANTLNWQKRTHDKQRNDGWAAKSADYFAYHYADELDIEEHKRWWGNDEF